MISGSARSGLPTVRTIWRLTVAGIVGACAITFTAAGLAFISPAKTPREAAQADAREILRYSIPSTVCAGRCHTGVDGKTPPNSWRVWISKPSQRRCFVVDLRTFAVTEDYGLTGLQSVACA